MTVYTGVVKEIDGWVSLHRQIQNHWVWEDKPFSKGQAWIDMLMLANHKDNKFLLGNELMHVKRGSFITSVRKLGERWEWSNKKIVSFLKLLQNDKMIAYESNTKRTLVTIEKYDFYQCEGDTEETQREHEGDTQRTQMHTNNNDNNDNNDNKNISLQISNLRARYSDKQQRIIDDYFSILKHTRKSAKVSDSVVINIYTEWEKHQIEKVIYALHVYIHNPQLHDKKENYCYGIMRNTNMDEIERYKNTKLIKLEQQSKNDTERKKAEEALLLAEQQAEEDKRRWSNG